MLLAVFHMKQEHEVNRELVQTAADGRSRTFSTFRDDQGRAWLTLKIKNRDGQLVDSDAFVFTNAELAQFQQLVGRA